ncbi:MAG: NEW3 domain-containing protein, partial [bacterium]
MKLVISRFILCLGILFHFTVCFAQGIDSRKSTVQPATSTKAVVRAQNALIAVQAKSDEPNRGFFNIGTSDEVTLLYNFPQEPWSSHFSIRLDSADYSPNATVPGTGLLPLVSGPQLLPDSTITTTWSIDNVRIEQRLQPVQFSPATAAIRISYITTNNDSQPHDVGILLELDTMINANDSAPISTSFGYADLEQRWDAPNIPTFWQAFERTPEDPGLVAQGTLFGGDATMPDVLIVGAWEDLVDVAWDYSASGALYGDSAVLLRWNQVRLDPGYQTTRTTYYGIGEVNIFAGVLSLNISGSDLIRCFDGTLLPNPFEANLIVTNTGTFPATAVEANLQLPAGLLLAGGETATKPLSPANLNPGQSGTASWRIEIPPGTDGTTLMIDVTVTSASTASNSASLPVVIPVC